MDVARGIHSRLEPGVTHQLHDVLTPFHIRIRVRNAANSIRERPTGWASKHAQLFESSLQSLGIDAQRVGRLLTERSSMSQEAAGRGSQGGYKRAPVHRSAI